MRGSQAAGDPSGPFRWKLHEERGGLVQRGTLSWLLHRERLGGGGLAKRVAWASRRLVAPDLEAVC
jgi:hypothetical protein